MAEVCGWRYVENEYLPVPVRASDCPNLILKDIAIWAFSTALRK